MAELMEVTLNTTYFNQKCVNRWNYVASGTPAAVTYSFALISIMGFLPTTTTLTADTIGGLLQALTSPGLFFNSIIARSVYIDDDFYDSPFLADTHGLSASSGESVSPMTSFGFFSSRVKQSINRGYKRFAGLMEGDITNGGLLTSTRLTAQQALAEAMSETLTYTDEGNSLSFVPCVVQKEKYPVPDSDTEAYRYYPDPAEQLAHTAQGISWTSYESVRSQVSRQYGRGQ